MVCRARSLAAIMAPNKDIPQHVTMRGAIAMLMQHDSQDARGDAYARLAHDYPSVVPIVDACFNACSAVAHAWRLRRTRRILGAIDRDRLDDIGLSHDDLRNGRLGTILKKQHAVARPGRPWARVWRAAFEADRCRKALAALGHDQLHNLSEQGLKARRDALHEHGRSCTCRTTGAHP